MPPRQKSPTKGSSWRAIALSILLHAGIVGAAVYSWFSWKHRPPEAATLAIEGTVVDERTLPKNSTPPAPAPAPPEPTPPEPAPEPEPPPVEEQGPPKPDPAEIERKQEEARLAAEKIEQDKRDQQKRDEDRQAQEVNEREETQRREAEKQAAAEKAAVEKAAADKKAAEKKRADDAAAAKKATDEKARLAREAELRRSLEAEERANAASSSDEANRWHAQIVAKITRAWIRPPSARAGVECNVSVNQVPGVTGGEVTAVKVNSCTGGDEALRESVERAVYNASPLPAPPPGVPFERILELTFAPNE